MCLIIIIIGLAASSVNARECTTCDTSSVVNPDTCLVSKNGSGQSWMQMSESCLTDGGRLLLMEDNDTYIEKFYKSPLVYNLTSSTDRLVIALMISQSNDQNVILYDKSVVRNNASCSKVSLPNCMNDLSHYLNQTNCENIGCCWKNNKCSYPGMGHLLSFNTFVIVPIKNVSGRGCMYMQKDNGTFVKPKWIGTDCFVPAARKTKFICEYACSGSTFPTRKTVTVPFVGGLATTPLSAGRNNSSSKSSISGSNSSSKPSISGSNSSSKPSISGSGTGKGTVRNSSSGLGSIQLMYVWSVLFCIVLLTDLRHV